MAEKKKETTPTMRMGCDLLDLLVGGAKGVYGLPFGAILNLIGDKSAGKSFLKNEIIAANYWRLGADRFKWESDDTESGDTFDTTGLYGFDIHPSDRRIGTKRVEDAATIEEMDAKVSLFLDSMEQGQFGVYAVDSLDGLSDATRESMEEDANVALVIVSQIRDKMNAAAYGPKWEVSCGKALEFYSHTRVYLQTIKKIEADGRVIGAYVRATTIKSKTPRPYREVFYSVYFDYGVDNVGSNLDYLFDLRNDRGELKKDACASIMWDGGAERSLANLTNFLESEGKLDQCRHDKKVEKGSGSLSIDWANEWITRDQELAAKSDAYFGHTYTRDELIRAIDRDPKMGDELTRRVREKWEAAEDAIKTDRPSKYGRA